MKVVLLAILATQLVEQALWSLPMVEFYFGVPFEMFGELSPMLRVGYSLAPIGFVVTPMAIGAIAMRGVTEPKPERMVCSYCLSLLGHVVYVLIVGVADAVVGFGILALLVPIVAFLALWAWISR